MNYVGSISIIDRGDAPAKAIIDKNTRSLAQRVADETKEELDKVMDRVDNIYVSYEMSTQTMFENPRGSPNVEYIEDIKELEDILTDTVKKKKYQQQVTVFIVGFQDICATKMQLLQQVNQFFLENSKLEEEEELEDKQEIDLEEASNQVNESLSTAEDLAKKLNDLNQDIIEWLVNYANTKASNKNPNMMNYDKGKKRLEKNLESAKNDMNSLSEKLLTLQAELEEKDEKFQQIAKQLDVKTQEVVRYKTAAEVAKKSAQDNETHTTTLQDEITKRDEKIQEYRTKLSRLEINMTESQFEKEMSLRKLDNTQSQTKEKLAKLQEEVETKKIAINDAERELEKHHKDQLMNLQKDHKEEIDGLKKEHLEEISKLTEELHSIQTRLNVAERHAQETFDETDELRAKIIELKLQEKEELDGRPTSRHSSDRLSSGKSIGELSTGDEDHQPTSKQESRQSTKDTKSKKPESKPIKTASKSPNRIGKDKLGGRSKELADASVQDEGGDSSKALVEKSNEPSRQPTRQSKNLDTVVETGDGQEFSSAFELNDEESWSSVPPANTVGRFSQYRQLSLAKIKELEEQLNITLTKTHRKVNSLKQQFSEHKGKWETERKILIEQVEQAQKLQTDAEKEADAAMTQLEEFINEQEKLEDEEETKRQEIIKTMSRPGTTRRVTPAIIEQKERATPEAVEKPEEELPQGERIHSENSEQELKKLMQQTDDAKSRTETAMSLEGETPLAPWLTPNYIQGTTKERQDVPSEPQSEPLSSRMTSAADHMGSRLTSVADAEIQKILPDDGAETRMSDIVERVVPKKKNENVLAIEGLKGDREKLWSRTSSKASRPPRITGQIDERDEEVIKHLPDTDDEDDDEEETDSCESDVAPWFTQTEQRRKPRSSVDSRQTSTKADSEEEMTGESSRISSVIPKERPKTVIVVMDSNKNENVEEKVLTRSKSVELRSFNNLLPRSHASRSSLKQDHRDGKQKVKKKHRHTKQKETELSDDEVQKQPKLKRRKTKSKSRMDDKESAETEQSRDEKRGQSRQGKRTGTERMASTAKFQEEIFEEVDRGELDLEKAFRESRVNSEFSDEGNISDTNIKEDMRSQTNELERNSESRCQSTVDKGKTSQMSEETIPMTTRMSEDTLPFGTRMSEITAPLTTRMSEVLPVVTRMSEETFPVVTRMSEVTLPVAMETDSESEISDVEEDISEMDTQVDVSASRVSMATDEEKMASRLKERSRSILSAGPNGARFEPQSPGNHRNKDMMYTSQSENQPRKLSGRLSQPQVSSVDVLSKPEDTNQEAQEKSARHSGAISAPPAVEPEEAPPLKKPDLATPREDDESRPVTPKHRKLSANQSVRNASQQRLFSPPKQAFRTPRPVSRHSGSSLSEESFDLENEATETDEGVHTDLAPVQSRALMNLKTMMSEDNLTVEQQKTLESLRSAIRTMSREDAKRDRQLERTVTILSLASQIAHESAELGVKPDSVFHSFAGIDSRAISASSDKILLKESSKTEKNGQLADRKIDSHADETHGIKPLQDASFKLVPESTQQHVHKSKSKTRELKATELEEVIKTEKSKRELRVHGKTRAIKNADTKSNSHTEAKAIKVSKEKHHLEDKQKKLFESLPEKANHKKERNSTPEFSISGSMSNDYLSSRGDSFSASIPRTVTSSEWRRLSTHDPFSPEPIKPIKKSAKEVRVVSQGTQSDLSMEDIEDGVATINVVVSPKKKSRNVTREEMLYGEGSMHVAPTGNSTAMDILEIPDENFYPSRSHSKIKHGLERHRSLGIPILQEYNMSDNIPETPQSIRSQSSPILIKKSHSKAQTPSFSEPPLTPASIPRQSSMTLNPTPRTIVTPGTSVSEVQRAISPASSRMTLNRNAVSPAVAMMDVHRPVSISSVQPTICATPPTQLCKETQTDAPWSNVEREPVKGNTEDEVRVSSAKSRASLRNQFKSRLDETRHAVEERRTKSPVISVPSQKSIDDELILEEDDEDLPIPDDLKEEALFKEDTMEMGTSPPPGPKEKRTSVTSRQSINLSEHPVVQEYLRAYTGIHNFKEAMSRVLVDKDQMSASQILSDLDIVPFDKEDKVVPQVSRMTDNVYYVLNEVSQVINSVLQNDRGPVVSSLMMGMSRDPTQRTIVREKTGVTTDLGTRGSVRSVSTKVNSASTERQQYRELQEHYEKLQNQMSQESHKYEDQQRHNMVVMMEMQDTINQLQRELSALGKQSRRPQSEHISTSGASQTAESTVMFTRLDSERNAKIMKKAVNEEKLETGKYKEAMVQMDDYVSLPAQRLAHLVRKYVHHCRMKAIEENVQQSNSLNENVFEILDKMEALQNQRARRWADRMDEMGMERLRLANMLMETLDNIEQESGIFLIKPMYSYRGREPKDRFAGKISRPFRPQRALSPLRDTSSAYAPAPTPASNIRAVVKTSQGRDTSQLAQSQEQTQGRYEPPRQLEGDSKGLLGSSIMTSQPRTTWSMADSMPMGENFKQNHMNTPRILELDINRMMIGQNTISAQIGNPGLSNDRLVNAANNNLRSYMTVNRPTGPGSGAKADRPNSGSRQSPHSPSSPQNLGASAKRVRMSSDIDVPTVMTSTQPLPPIGSNSRPSSGAGNRRSPTRIPSGDVPQSPPGSSLRQSPPGMKDTEVV